MKSCFKSKICIFIILFCINFPLFFVFANDIKESTDGKINVFSYEQQVSFKKNIEIVTKQSDKYVLQYDISNIIKKVKENELVFISIIISLLVSTTVVGIMIQKNKKIYFVTDQKINIKQKTFVVEKKQDTFFNTSTMKKKRH